ncbi:iron-containing alcohol dehydrogenase [Fertoebacter nigrum]|uniref:Iron-containing alcohol dehydrogenase n=1 Tax=Fertoeibacter niger TaxID=2656921 RepID=A0A8X8KRW2_9RHOB|nr:iron-containing alcohol dehydrogenase [Fertoeibacter niger]
MTPYAITLPGRILFGRGEAARAPALIRAFGERVLVVHGAQFARADWLVDALAGQGVEIQRLPCAGEPDLAMLEEAIYHTRGFEPQVVVGLGGGAVLDMAKALAALIPAPGGPMDHLEVVGRGLPLVVAPLPFCALPTTAGTGAEATKNAVIGVPGRKVSLRDDRMLARVAIVDPALTDGCPRGVTLASGLDAITQVIEPYVSCRATPFTDAVTRPAIAQGLAALRRLMQGEDSTARDALAQVSLTGGMALANAGLGAVHGLAGVIGGVTGAAHGAVCGVLLAPVLAMNAARAVPGSVAAVRLAEVLALLRQEFGASDGAAALADWAADAGLPRLTALGLDAAQHRAVAEAAQASSSMKGNPVPLSVDDLVSVLRAAG